MTARERSQRRVSRALQGDLAFVVLETDDAVVLLGESQTPTASETWATISFALARDVNRIKRVCTLDHPPRMGSPTPDWPAGTETRHPDGTRCVLLEDGDYAVIQAPSARQAAVLAALALIEDEHREAVRLSRDETHTSTRRFAAEQNAGGYAESARILRAALSET